VEVRRRMDFNIDTFGDSLMREPHIEGSAKIETSTI